MSTIQSSPFIQAQERRDSLTRLNADAEAKGAATNDIKALVEGIIELPPIMTGCKEGTDKEKDKEKEKDRENACREQSYFSTVPALSAGAEQDVSDLRLAPGALVF